MKSLLVVIAISGSLAAQVEPKAGQWRTWVIPSGSSMRVAAPPPDDVTAQELAWVKQCVKRRDQPTLDVIRYWDSGPPAYRWMQIAVQSVANSALTGPQQTRALALVAAAISDATVAAWDSKYAYARRHPSDLDPTVAPVVTIPNSPSYPSEHAATAAAAATVLAYLFPDQAMKLDETEYIAAYSRITAGAAFPSDVSAGIELGGAVGEAVVASARQDGSSVPNTSFFPATQGIWSSANPVTPLAGAWRPWVLAQGNEFRLVPPPAFGTDAATSEYNAVKNLNRTNATNHMAWFWQPGFFQPWMETLHLELFQNHLDSNAPRAARAYAYETIAQHDATLACWDTKYTYLELRPSQADPTITPVFANPQHPGYPSGHACASGASAAVLSFLFPADAQEFARMAAEAGASTFDAGIHTQLDVSQGLVLGKNVGEKVAARAGADGAN